MKGSERDSAERERRKAAESYRRHQLNGPASATERSALSLAEDDRREGRG